MFAEGLVRISGSGKQRATNKNVTKCGRTEATSLTIHGAQGTTYEADPRLDVATRDRGVQSRITHSRCTKIEAWEILQDT